MKIPRNVERGELPRGRGLLDPPRAKGGNLVALMRGLLRWIPSFPPIIVIIEFLTVEEKGLVLEKFGDFSFFLFFF